LDIRVLRQILGVVVRVAHIRTDRRRAGRGRRVGERARINIGLGLVESDAPTANVAIGPPLMVTPPTVSASVTLVSVTLPSFVTVKL
jgi:hypothetical protein